MEIRNRNKFLGIDDYDDRGNVKTGLFLQFALVYFSRFLLYGPISLLAGRGLRYDVSFLTDVSPALMIASIPTTVMLFLLMVRRSVTRGRVIETLFKNGKMIMLGSGILQIILVVYDNFLFSNPSKLSNILLTGLFFNFLMVFLVWKSERINLVFREIKN